MKLLTRLPAISRVRVVEKAAGRMATAGIVTGAIVENLYSVSFLTQLRHEIVPITILGAVISVATARAHPQGIDELEKLKDPEIINGRVAMVLITLLFGMEFIV